MKNYKPMLIMAATILFTPLIGNAQNYSCPIKIEVTNQTDSNLSKIKIENSLAGVKTDASKPQLSPGSSLDLAFQNGENVSGQFAISVAGGKLCYGSYNLQFGQLTNPCKVDMNFANYSVSNNPQQISQQKIRCKQTGILNVAGKTTLTVGVEKIKS